MQSMAVNLAPVFTYNKGRLHGEETKTLEQLKKGNHNLDWNSRLCAMRRVMTVTCGPWCTLGGLPSRRP